MDQQEINNARKSFLKLKPDYSVEFLWTMSKYNACSMCDAEALIRTPSIKRHTASFSGRIHELISGWPVTVMDRKNWTT
jgi:hypothetical protein